MKRCSRLVLLLLVVGCAAVKPYEYDWVEPPKDFPRLEVKIIKFRFNQEQEVCAKLLKMKNTRERTVLACSTSNLSTKVCKIYIAEDAEQSVIDHEMLHCKGWTHIIKS